MIAAVGELTTVYIKRVSKPWGYELVTTPPTLPYTGKLLFIAEGRRLSLQSHDAKTETLTLVSGLVRLTIEDEMGVIHEVEMEPGVGYTVLPSRRHRLSAATESIVMEASTPECGVTRRFEDDYGRPDECEADRTAAQSTVREGTP